GEPRGDPPLFASGGENTEQNEPAPKDPANQDERIEAARTCLIFQVAIGFWNGADTGNEDDIRDDSRTQEPWTPEHESNQRSDLQIGREVRIADDDPVQE